MYRVIVCGGRDFVDRSQVYGVLDMLAAFVGCLRVAEGGARGADTLAREWAKERGVPCRTVEADWTQHGKKAGPIRNQRMLDEHRPHLVLAFAGGSGTEDMVKRAAEAKVKIVRIATCPSSTASPPSRPKTGPTSFRRSEVSSRA